MLKKNPFSTPSEILHHSLEFIKSHNIQQDVIVLVSVPSYKKNQLNQTTQQLSALSLDSFEIS